MTAPAPQPTVPPISDLDYSEVALETVAGLKKISKFATRLEDWFDLWSQSMLMPSLGVMQQAASLISRMTSVRKTLVHALNSLESPDPADNSPDPTLPPAPREPPIPGSAFSSESPGSQISNSSSSRSDSLLKETLQLSNLAHAEARRLADATGLCAPPSSTPLDPDPDPDPDLDLNPALAPPPPPAPHPISSLPSLPRLSIPAIASCPTIPLKQIPAAAVALERKFRRLTASSFPDEESKRLSDAEAAELFEYLQDTSGDGRSPATLSPQEFPLKHPDFSSHSSVLVSSSTKIASPPAPPPSPGHPPPGCYDD